MVLVDDAAEDPFAPYGRVEVGHDRRVVKGRSLSSALMWTMSVEVPFVLAQHGLGVAVVVDQYAVGTFGADAAHEPLGIGVRPRRPRRRLDHLDALGGEHSIDRRSPQRKRLRRADKCCSSVRTAVLAWMSRVLAVLGCWTTKHLLSRGVEQHNDLFCID